MVSFVEVVLQTNFKSDLSYRTSPLKRRAEAKKMKLRMLLGDTVDLDMVPQITCEPDGVVVLDNPNTKGEGGILVKYIGVIITFQLMCLVC